MIEATLTYNKVFGLGMSWVSVFFTRSFRLFDLTRLERLSKVLKAGWNLLVQHREGGKG